MKKFSFVLAFVIAFADFAQSQSIVTDRPDQTESSVTVPFKSIQIETGFLYAKENGMESYLLPTTLLRFGFWEKVELRLATSYNAFKDSGFGDVELGLKFMLYDKEEANIQMAFLSHVVLPVGAAHLTNDKVGSINKLAISHSISDNFGLGYNVGYNYWGEGSGDLNYSLAFAFGISDKIGFFIEPYGELVEFEDFILNGNAGFTYLIHDNMQLDCSYGLGLNHNMDFVSFGFSWNIPY